MSDQSVRAIHIPWWKPRIGDQEEQLVRKVLGSGFLNDGEVTTRFERRIADLLGCRHAVAVTSGTAAIFLALKGLGIGPGDEVIIPDLTFIATANAVSLTGARPVLADVDPKSLCLDPKAFEAAVTKKTKAVVPVHVSGRAGTLPAVLEDASRLGLAVVEDAAEAFLSKNKKFLGTFGKAGCFSFSPMKTITCGQGGLVVTDDDKLHERLRELKDQGRPVRGTGGDDPHPAVGYNFKLTNLQAAVGMGQMADLDDRLKKLKDIYRWYREGLNGLPECSLIGFELDRGESPQWIDAFADRRDELVSHLLSRGMECRRFWHPLHTQPPYRQPDDRFPVSSKQGYRAMWLPSALTIAREDVRAVCKEIHNFFGRG